MVLAKSSTWLHKSLLNEEWMNERGTGSEEVQWGLGQQEMVISILGYFFKRVIYYYYYIIVCACMPACLPVRTGATGSQRHEIPLHLSYWRL